ncbi:MAG: glutamate-cysteine ligase regulatory subunit [Benjaminiella poitrasii]|nr:MAG: glutamate-cysteine ligase regulatory subunit [Benjaminiella poitrasii]
MPTQLFTNQIAIPTFRQLVLYTGNVMLTATTANKYWNRKSNTELVQAISDTLKVSLYEPETPSYRYFTENELLEVPDIRLSSRIHPDDRDDVEVTAKLFYLGQDHNQATHIDRAIYHLQKLLDVKLIDTFIISFDNNDINLATIEKSWKDLEAYHEQGVISKLGVSDFDFKTLSDFLQKESVQVKPAIDQIHVSQCSSLPQDLINLGKQHQIEITFNGDTTDILTTEVLTTLLSQHGVINEMTQVKPRWVLKYDVFFKRRSIVADKGYIVVGDSL